MLLRQALVTMVPPTATFAKTHGARSIANAGKVIMVIIPCSNINLNPSPNPNPNPNQHFICHVLTLMD